MGYLKCGQWWNWQEGKKKVELGTRTRACEDLYLTGEPVGEGMAGSVFRRICHPLQAARIGLQGTQTPGRGAG